MTHPVTHVQLGDVATISGGRRLPKGTSLTSIDNGAPYLRIVDIRDSSIDVSKLMFVPEDVQPRIDRYRIHSGDIFISIVGTVGLVSRVPNALDGIFLTENAAKISPNSGTLDDGYLYYFLRSASGQASLDAQTVGTTQKKLALSRLGKVTVPLKSMSEQLAVSNVLDSLDEAIHKHLQVAKCAEALAMALYKEAVCNRDRLRLVQIGDIATIARGITPTYVEEPDGLIVLNQKCIRDQRVALAPSRLTLRARTAESKLLRQNDVLVNSTGVGTLGRLARWIGTSTITADSHISIVRFDTTRVDPTIAGFGMLASQPNIESLGEGSTGQTELSREQLGRVEIAIPEDPDSSLARQLATLTNLADRHVDACEPIAELRDYLIPRLISGAITVGELNSRSNGL